MSDHATSSARALLCLLSVGLLLGCSVILAKLADQAGAPRLTFLMLGALGAAAILTAAARWQAHALRLDVRTIEYAFVAGVLFALPNALAFLGVRHVGAGLLSLSFAFPMLLTWVIAVVLRIERLRAVRLFGVLTGMSGGLILATGNTIAGGGSALWTALVIVIPVVLAIGNVYRSVRWPANTTPLFLAALMLYGAALSLLPFALVTEFTQWQGMVSAAVLQLLFFEISLFSLLYYLYFVLQRIVSPVYFSQIGVIAAVMGTGIAIAFLGESPPSRLGLAATLVVAGTLIFQHDARVSNRKLRIAARNSAKA